MERRRSTRKQLRQRVTLGSPHTEPVTVSLRNASLGGMFVETGAVSLPRNAIVTVSFGLARAEKDYDFNLDAMVVRRDQNGVALMFLQMKMDVIRALSESLSHPSFSIEEKNGAS